MERLAQVLGLCEALHCTPSQLFQEDGYLIEGFKGLLVARAEKQQQDIDKAKKGSS